MKMNKTNINSSLKTKQGFTLIELLIVIAVLGVLAAVILVAINPLEQLARGRDSGRKSSVSQLGNAIQAYYTAQNGVYPVATASVWGTTTLKNAGEIKVMPQNPAASYTANNASWGSCTSPAMIDSGFCYNTGNDGSGHPAGLIYIKMESGSEASKCGLAANTWYVWDSTVGQAGIYCNASEPTVTSTFTSLVP